MKMGLARFASVHPTRDSEATETNDLKMIELLNTTGFGSAEGILSRRAALDSIACRGFQRAQSRQLRRAGQIPDQPAVWAVQFHAESDAGYGEPWERTRADIPARWRQVAADRRAIPVLTSHIGILKTVSI